MKAHIENCVGFEWDDGNSNKNFYRHGITDSECEDVFFNLPMLILSDVEHSKTEERYFALGRTDVDRWLFIAFTIRENLIRVISARDMTKSEERKYAEKIKRDTEI